MGLSKCIEDNETDTASRGSVNLFIYNKKLN